jgi:hypothetical protein
MGAGKLKMWNADRGFGFIKDDAGVPVRTAPTRPARSLLPHSSGCETIAPSDSGDSDDITRTGTNSSTAAVATGASFAPARADTSAGANAAASPPAAELGAENEGKVKPSQ